MVQPVQYQVPGVTDPFASVVQGLRLGATLQELDLARAAQQQKLAQQQAQAEQQRQANDAISAYLAKPSGQRTEEDTRGLIRFLPAEQVKNLLEMDSRLSETERRNQVLFAGQVGSALRLGNTDVALQMVRQRAEAETDPMKKQGFQILAQSIEKAPEAALETLRVSTTALGKDYEPAARAMFGAPAEQGRMISTPEAKRAAGLVNDKGAPLPGTFFQEPGKEPKLITGEKPQELPAEIRTMQTLGFPLTQDGWAAYTAQKRGPAVQVSVGGEAKPTAFQQELDKKFAPIAVDWLAGERAQATSRINQLDAVVKTLETKKRITGPVLGLMPDVVNAFTATASREARANAERVIQEGLRATLGAQFTKVEGENFLARAYDPKAPQADNARRLRSIVAQMKASARDREAMLKYVQGPGKGSLVGYTGRVPSIADFYAAIDEKPPEEAPAAASPAPAAPPGFGPRAVSGTVTPAEASPVATPAVSTRALPNQAAIDFLRRNPSLRGAFDEKYGPGAAARVLGGQ